MANVGSVEYSIRADTQQFQTSVRNASDALNGMGTSIRPLMRQLASLGGMSASTGRSMSVLTRALGAFGTGNAIQLGVVAGVAALNIALQYLRRRTMEAREEAEKFEQAWRNAGRAAYEASLQFKREKLSEQVDAARAEEARLAQEVAALDVKRAKYGEGYRSSKWKNLSADLAAVRRELYGLLLTGMGEMTEISVIFDDRAAAKAEEASATYERALRRVRDALGLATQAWRDFARFNPDPTAFGPKAEILSPSIATDFETDMLRWANNAIAADLRTRREEFKAIGASLGDRFAEGFAWSAIQGFQGLGALLKNILMSILSSVISMGMKAAGGGIAGFIFDAIGMGGNLSHAPAFAGDVGVTRGGPSMSMSVNVGAASDPFSLARDAQWQMALRESIRFANSQGFRG